jgi:hypothetical protein
MTMANGAAAGRTGERHMRLTYQSIVNVVFAIFVFSGLVSFVEPSPYDFMALVAIPIWFFGGFKIHRVQVPIIILWCVFELSGFAALMPHWDDADSRVYQFQSLYLFLTVICFTLFFGERTLERAEICLKAFTLGAVVSAFVSILSYFDILGLGVQLITVEGRVSGTFKDPNVFGSYLTLGAAFVFQDLLIGNGKRRILSAIGLLILLIGVFISYSRGSWGATTMALTLVTIVTYVTSQSKSTRPRIIIMSAIIAAVAALTMLAILSNDDVREFFFQRAGTHDYDEGATGRFGNQFRSIPMLLDRPEGFGPLRFRQYFDIEPHNSYIGGFANDGWIGGFSWIFIVLSTTFVGFRLIFVQSPYRRLAQVAWPALFVLFLQGFQIDIDHWRQVFLLCGMIWGFEAARVRWREREQRVVEQPSPLKASETYA